MSKVDLLAISVLTNIVMLVALYCKTCKQDKRFGFWITEVGDLQRLTESHSRSIAALDKRLNAASSEGADFVKRNQTNLENVREDLYQLRQLVARSYSERATAIEGAQWHDAREQ